MENTPLCDHSSLHVINRQVRSRPFYNTLSTIEQQSNNKQTTIEQQSNNNPASIQQQSNNARITIQQQSNNTRTFFARQTLLSCFGLLSLVLGSATYIVQTFPRHFKQLVPTHVNLRKSAFALLRLNGDLNDGDLNDGDLNDGNDTKVVYIIRHGEKVWMPSNETAYRYACESEQGWARAYNMPSVFGTPPKQGFRTPDALFSYNYDDGDLDCRTARGYYRTQATIAPLGQALGLEINNRTGSKPDLCGLELGSHVTDDCHLPPAGGSPHDFGTCCNSAAAAAMKAGLFNEDAETQSVLASWEHANIAYLVSALAGSEVDIHIEWPVTQFDTVVAMYFDAATGEFLRFDEALYQGFQWLGSTAASTVDYSFGPGEKPGIN